jgi:pyridoxal biosynthesis lyase PdxS
LVEFDPRINLLGLLLWQNIAVHRLNRIEVLGEINNVRVARVMFDKPFTCGANGIGQRRRRGNGAQPLRAAVIIYPKVHQYNLEGIS